MLLMLQYRSTPFHNKNADWSDTVYKRRARDPTSRIICLTSGLGIQPDEDNKVRIRLEVWAPGTLK